MPGYSASVLRSSGIAWFLCLALVLLSTTRVSAQPSHAASETARAESLFEAGIALANQERYAEAAEKFKQSYAADPVRGTLLALALAEEKGGQLAAAYGHYQTLLSEARQAGDMAREETAAPKVRELEARVGKLTLLTSSLPSGTELRVDDVVVSLGIGRVVIAVDPGGHSIRAHGANGAKFERDVALVAGAALSVEVRLDASSSTPKPVTKKTTSRTPPPRVRPEPRVSKSPLSTLGWVSVGVGAASLGVGSYLWLRSGAIYDEVVDACKTEPNCATEQRDHADQGRRMENWGRVALIGGGVVAATGITLLLVAPRSDKAKSARVILSPSGVSVRGGF